MDSYSSFSSNPSSCDSTSIAANSNAKEKQQQKKKGTAGGKLSTDPQSVAARQRRHRISDRFKILQSLVPGGSRMDTVSLLEEAIQYVKFLKHQIFLHQSIITTSTLDADHHNAHHHHHAPNTMTTSYYNIPSADYYDCSPFDHHLPSHHQVVDHHFYNNNNNNYSSSWDDQIMLLQGGEMTADQQLPWFHSDDENVPFDASLQLPGPFN